MIRSDLDLPSLEAALRERLRTPLPGPDAQRRFAPLPALKSWDPAARPAHARQAAALLLLYPGAMGASLVLTERHADLPHHGGQISLPGGGMHKGEGAAEAALREAHEEIGVEPRAARVVGPLSSLWVLVSSFVVHPIIAIADARPDFAVSPREVETLIEVPVAVLLDRARLRWQRRLRSRPDGPGTALRVPYFALDEDAPRAPGATTHGHQVWGATAMILGEFCALLDPGFGPGPAPDSLDEGSITLF
ncbi:MAG TPA: CoA pyrophosphatase [Vicinamibacterales bacterium]|nr:CoA pyrophosphatase [Vicinamibacterales bacterium]